MTTVALSNQPAIDALLYGTGWPGMPGATTLSFGFPGALSTWAAYAAPAEPYQGFAPLGSAAQAAVRTALLAWSSVAGIGFAEVSDDATSSAQIRVAMTTWQMGAQQLAYSYLPSNLDSGGDVWLNAALGGSIFQNLPPASLASYTLLHELGHSLGLKHPGEISAYGSSTLASQDNTLFNTVMSIFVLPGVSLSLAGNIDRLPSTPMGYDIDALQYLYGANTQYHSGNDVYAFDSSSRYLETIYDTGGADTIAITGSQGGKIDLRPGQWSQLGLPVQINGGAVQHPDTVFIHRSTQIENATGGDGADTLLGNDLANVLRGNGGDDTLLGGAGADVLVGGAGADAMAGGDGNDNYYVDNAGDSVTESNPLRATGGIDAVVASVSWSLSANLEILLLTGSSVYGIGNSRDNYIEGTPGANFLSGAAGADTMQGGDGNDAYYVDNSADVVIETHALPAGGIDVVVSSVTYALGANLEYLLLSGHDAITGIGNGLGNYIEGNTARNYLFGGAGSDTLQGYDGDDVYYVDDPGDVVIETSTVLASGGRDTVSSSISYHLGTNVENLLLSGVAGIDGSGNGLANYITGNAAANALAGLGGNDTLVGDAGADTLTGGPGADSFDFNALSDALVGGNRDVITDFSRAQGDRVDLAGIDANSLLASDQAFSFIGAAAFGSVTGQLRFAASILSGDTDGNGTADFEIQLTGVASLLASDLLL